MVVENNKRLLQRFQHDVIDAKNLSALNGLTSPNFRHHDLAPGEQTKERTGREGLKQFFAGTVFPAFSNFSTEFADLIGEGDLVAGRWTLTVRQSGPWLGKPATNRTATIGGISVIRARCNLILEEWEARDTATLFATFGIAPKLQPLTAVNSAYSRDVEPVAPIADVLTGGPLPEGPYEVAERNSASWGAESAASAKAPVLAYVAQVLNDGNISLVDRLFAPGFVDHEPLDGQKFGPEGIKQFVNHLRGAFPDVIVTPDLSFSEGDKVVVRWTVMGTHTGAFLGAAPTGRNIKVSGIHICRVTGNAISEKWGYWPTGEIFQQLNGRAI